MVDLAFIRKVRTQFVYLTATLPPALYADFENQNHLVNPKIIRAPANRLNLSYVVIRVPGPSLSRGRHFRQTFCARRHFRLHAAGERNDVAIGHLSRFC
jgi:superfamily II DNA helicase RecQ